MSVLTVQGVSLSYVGRTVLKDAGFQISPGDRVGLVGPNGSGKTSLLKIISGRMAPDKGTVAFAKGVRVGYLAQDVQETGEGRILDSVVDSVPGRVELRAELDRVEHQLAAEHDEERQTKLSLRLAELHADQARLDAHYPPHDAARILGGLGFGAPELGRPVGELSGGWKMRAALARLLYQKPELLLLDEPTNHLDIPSVRWLEEFLRSFPGSIMLVCHDRDFLNRQIDRVIALEPEGVRTHTGNFDSYVEARELEMENLEGALKNQDAKLRQVERFIDRFKAKASKARQVQSRIKQLEKVERVVTLDSYKTLQFRFPEVTESGRNVLSLKGLSKSFAGKSLYQGLDLFVTRGDRVGLIGPIGSGKTTLLKIVAGELSPDGGTVSFGHNVTLSYYAQHQSDTLEPERTVVEEVMRAAGGETMSRIRQVCGAFLFSGEDVDKKTRVLSGGEKARVCLAKLLVRKANFMVMDEPTNHLDLASSESLIDALAEFTGTLLFVSHNQAFVNRLATRIWDLRGDGTLFDYPGTLYEYYDYLERRAKEAKQGKPEKPIPPKGPQPAPAAKAPEKSASHEERKQAKKDDADRRQRLYHKLRPLKADLKKVEDEVAALEARKKQLGDQLADPSFYGDKEKSVPALKEFGELDGTLAKKMAAWEKLQTEIERTEKAEAPGA